MYDEYISECLDWMPNASVAAFSLSGEDTGFAILVFVFSIKGSGTVLQSTNSQACWRSTDSEIAYFALAVARKGEKNWFVFEIVQKETYVLQSGFISKGLTTG